MDLIKKLGGYEEAKRLRGTTSNALLDMKTWKVHVDDIDLSLLEHRRQHNIFEVGDLVVGRCYEDYDDSILTITEKFDHFGNPSVVFECERTICDDFESELRHATDKEIAAGHRL